MLAGKECLLSYGMTEIASIDIQADQFRITVTDTETTKLDHCIYAFVIGDEIVRIGSSKAPLLSRLKSWERDVTKRLMGKDSSTPQWEADGWRTRLAAHQTGQLFARRGTTVRTPVGEFPVYLDEESVLIGRHLPPLNGSKHR